MAYLDLAAGVPFGSFQPVTVPTADPVRLPQRLTGAERSAVMLARIDNTSSLKGQSVARKIARLVFGFQPTNKLADIRLETLRRFAVAVAHGRSKLIDWEMNELRLLRFEEAQIDEAANLAAQFARAPQTGLWMQMLFGLLVVGAFLWARETLGDTMVALITVAAPALPLWALIAPRNAAREGRR